MENQVPYNVSPEESKEALEMLGKGYDDHPTVIIEPPRIVTARRDGRMVDIEEPAWVKFSTNFKKELKTLDEYSLKVFLYIGLSVNFRTGTAWPGVRKIATETGMDKDTVSKATANLEILGFLTIQKRVGDSNIYKPTRYISIGTVRPEGTPATPELSDEKSELSDEKSELSDVQEGNLHNKNNKNQEELKRDDAEIFMALESVTGGLNTDTPRYVDIWKEKHPFDKIMEAIALAGTKGRKPVQYIDTILIGWESSGYPKTREEKVKDRKSYKGEKPGNDDIQYDYAALRKQAERALKPS